MSTYIYIHIHTTYVFMYSLINMKYNGSRATPRCEVMRIGNTYDPVTKRITSLNAFDPLLPPGLKRKWKVPRP